MKRTLAEWEKLWREQWDVNQHADLDGIFSELEDIQEDPCELTIVLTTKEGRIDTVLISILLHNGPTIVTEHEYRIDEIGRVELNKLIESLN